MDHLADGHNGDIRPRTLEVGLAERNRVGLFGDWAFHPTQGDIFKEDHQVVVADRRDQ